MKNEEIVRALRCVSTAGGENACEHCPYWKEEEVPEEERPIYGADTMHSCDVDRVGLDGADLIERLTARCARYAEEIAVAHGHIVGSLEDGRYRRRFSCCGEDATMITQWAWPKYCPNCGAKMDGGADNA